MNSSETKCRAYLKASLGLKKVSCKWVPHDLTNDQKIARVAFCNNFLKHYEDLKKKSTYEILSGDETWLTVYNPFVASQSKVWVQKKETPISVRRKSISDEKILTSVFFSRQGILNTSYLKSKEKASSEWYINSVLTPFTTNWLKTELVIAKKIY